MTTKGGEHERLDVLVGRWRTQGWTREGGDRPAVQIEATDTYGWLPGGFALIHTVDARVGDQKVDGAEIIGYDPARASYVTQYFGSDGPAGYEATLEEESEGLVWTMRGEATRFAGRFMDAYADAMIARGPTLNEDGTAATGSMHIVDLPNEEAARASAFDEPNYRSGILLMA
jgi:Protein of unknown function (DUF1579)/YCII-related domain